MVNGRMAACRDIEKRCFAIITAELGERTVSRRVCPRWSSGLSTRRRISTTRTACAFSADAVGQAGKGAGLAGATVVTDTNMALAGVSKADAGQALGGRAVCLHGG